MNSPPPRPSLIRPRSLLSPSLHLVAPSLELFSLPVISVSGAKNAVQGLKGVGRHWGGDAVWGEKELEGGRELVRERAKNFPFLVLLSCLIPEYLTSRSSQSSVFCCILYCDSVLMYCC